MGAIFCVSDQGERAAAKQAGGAKDTWAVMARLRAGHARPLRGAANGLRTRGAREGGSPPPLQWAGVDRELVVTQGPLEPFRPCRLGQLP